jgi:hypothetical protein
LAPLQVALGDAVLTGTALLQSEEQIEGSMRPTRGLNARRMFGSDQYLPRAYRFIAQEDRASAEKRALALARRAESVAWPVLPFSLSSPICSTETTC